LLYNPTSTSAVKDDFVETKHASTLKPNQSDQQQNLQQQKSKSSSLHPKPLNLSLNVSGHGSYDAKTVVLENKEDNSSLVNTTIYIRKNSYASLHDRLPTPKISSKHLNHRHSSLSNLSDFQSLSQQEDYFNLPSPVPPLPPTATSMISSVTSLTQSSLKTPNPRQDKDFSSFSSSNIYTNTPAKPSRLRAASNSTGIISEQKQTLAQATSATTTLGRQHSYKGRSKSLSKIDFSMPNVINSPATFTPEMPIPKMPTIDQQNNTLSITKMFTNFSWTNKKKKDQKENNEVVSSKTQLTVGSTKNQKLKSHRFPHFQKSVSPAVPPQLMATDHDLANKKVMRKPVSAVPVLNHILTDNTSVDPWIEFCPPPPELTSDSSSSSTSGSTNPSPKSQNSDTLTSRSLPANANTTIPTNCKLNVAKNIVFSAKPSENERHIEQLQHNYDMLSRKVKQLRQQKQLALANADSGGAEINDFSNLEQTEKQRYEAGLLLNRAYKRQRDRNGATEFWVRSVGLN
jgi:hypothetical protein